MLIDYGKENVITLPLCNKEKALEKTVMLVPGINEMPKHEWDRVATLPKIKRLIASKHIEVVSKVDSTDEEFALSKADVATAKKIIARTWNLLLLEDWKAGESRAGIIKLLNIQITDIEKKTAPRKKAVNE